MIEQDKQTCISKTQQRGLQNGHLGFKYDMYLAKTCSTDIALTLNTHPVHV